MKNSFSQKYGLAQFVAITIWVFLTTSCVKPIFDSANNPDFDSTTFPSGEESATDNQPGPDQPFVENSQSSPGSDSKDLVPAAGDNPFILHTVEEGETLGIIASQYEVAPELLIAFNQIEDVNLIFAGETLRIPKPGFESVTSPDLQIIPDSELVYGPSAKDFLLIKFLEPFDGHLNQYEEEVEGNLLTGPEVVQLVADRHSVNPRLLLAALENQSQWLTERDPVERAYPLGNLDEGSEGLYKQLSWAANLLNWGYYGRAEGGLSSFMVAESIPAIFSPDINHGTAGVQFYLAARDGIDYETWVTDLGPNGIAATYANLYGDPFAVEVDPLIPDDLEQPPFTLPWETGETWFFTGGPHGGWNTGSAWAALDFVPPDVQGGCFPSESWITAMSDGIVTRSSHGAVVIDLDGDRFAGTGWALIYMHLDNEDRILVGTEVETGDRLGHPGCEGGFANGTHLHVARTYNGRWISADGSLPMEMDGWISGGAGYEYNGWLQKGDLLKNADVMLTEENAITAD